MMKPIDTINVIPFIDVMLVLLAIVLATATFIAEGRLDLHLPAADSAAAASSDEAFRIAIDGQGDLFVEDRPIALADLARRLDALTPTTRVQLRVDRGAAFGGFVAVIDLLRARGLERLDISVLKP